MAELLIFGLLLGWGAAIPIGAINLEIIRRNLRFGTRTGVAFGMGACIADITYLVLLSYGVLSLLTSPALLKSIGVVGSIVLAWFGWTALRQKSELVESDLLPANLPRTSARNTRDGFLLTLINPYTIVFWSSVSMTIAANTKTNHATLYAGLGVLLSVLSWVLTLNVFLHFTRHRISNNAMHKINFIGGLILIGLAVMGLWHSYIM